MRGIDDDHVHARRGQQFDALLGVAANPDRRADQQARGRILGGVGVVGFLLDVLDRDQAAQLEAVVDHQDLLDAVAMQQLQHFLVAGAFAHGDQAILLGHDVADRIVELLLEAHVAAGDDADQLAAVDHRHAGNVARAGQFQHFADGRLRTDGERLGDHPGFELLDLGHFRRLLRRGQVLVDDADAAELGHGHREAVFGHRVHRRRQDRQFQAQVAGQPGFQADVLRQDDRMGGDERNVVIGKSFSLDAQHRRTRMWGSAAF